MDAPGAVENVDLREYLGVLRARRWTIIFVAAVVLSSALFFSFRQMPLYEARTRLLVKGVPTDASGFIQTPNLLTEAEIVASEPIATLVVDDLELDSSTKELISQVSVKPAQEESQVLRISYTSPDAAIAADIANSFAENYIEYKRTEASEALEAGRLSIQERISAVQEKLSRVTRRIDTPEVAGDPALRTTLETERSTLIARLGVLQQELDDFQSTQPIDLSGGQAIDPATPPTTAVSPDHLRNGLLALFLGLALGIGLAFLREHLDDRFRGRPDLIRSLDVPVLASVPKFGTRKREKQHALPIHADPRSPAAEAYKGLRTSIRFLTNDRSLRSLLITSASSSEGKTMTTANLAVALAQGGTKVIVVSADLRRPALELYFGIENSLGLSDWLLATDERDPFGIVHDPGIPNLRIIPSGPIPPNPAELLASRRFGTFIETLETQAELVLVDSPPVFPVTDPLVLISTIGTAILVIHADKTHRSIAVHAKEELERVGGDVVGCVYNSFDPSDSAYGRYNTYYQYGAYRQAEGPAGHGSDNGHDERTSGKSRALFGVHR